MFLTLMRLVGTSPCCVGRYPPAEPGVGRDGAVPQQEGEFTRLGRSRRVRRNGRPAAPAVSRWVDNAKVQVQPVYAAAAGRLLMAACISPWTSRCSRATFVLIRVSSSIVGGPYPWRGVLRHARTASLITSRPTKRSVVYRRATVVLLAVHGVHAELATVAAASVFAYRIA